MKRPKGKRGSKSKFIMIDLGVFNHAAFRSLKVGPRSLLFELIARFNGYNNGKIYLSSRQAAERLNCTKDTALAYFKVLEDRGFIVATKRHALGLEGQGRATEWRLTHQPCDGIKPTFDFIKKAKPRHEN